MIKLGKPKVLLFLSLHYWIKKKSRHQVLRLVCNHRGIKYRIEIKNLDNTLIVVVRYFGGILLGAGGLTRAYTKVASMLFVE